MTAGYASLELSAEHFRAISGVVYEVSGINLQRGKEQLVKTRLQKRIHQLGILDFEEYLALLRSSDSAAEVAFMVDVLTTNKTSFFRERQHFDYLRSSVLPTLQSAGQPIRIWSAGCSSGEEPLTLAMVLREEIRDLDRRDVRILATDISARVLARARAGLYRREQLDEVPAPLVKRYFEPAPGSDGQLRAGERLRGLISFARLNLMDAWRMRGPFQVIFCRNVMIYFDKPTRERLVDRFWEVLAPGGHLFVGHSESLTGLSHRYRYVRPAVYRK